MKKLLIIALLLLALLLVSCDGETPGESLPSESAPEVSTHVCDFSGKVEYDENGHFVTCECGEVSRNEHEFEDLKIIKEATCVEEGSKTIKCKDCKYQETVTIPKLEHTTVKHDEVPATCIEKGVTSYDHCDICDIDIGKSFIGYTEHKYEDDVCEVCGSWRASGLRLEQRDDGYYAYASAPYAEYKEIVIPKYGVGGKLIVGIGERAFADSTGNLKAKSVVIQSATIFELCAFQGGDMETFKFPEDPDSPIIIGEAAFHSCTSLKTIDLTGVGSIGRAAFQYCKSLRSIELSEKLTTLEEEAFSGCVVLDNVKLPDSLKKAGKRAFQDCYSLKNIDLGNGITELSHEMFKGCSALETIVIPDSVTEIGYNVFYGCDNLKTVVLPKSLTDMDGLAFYACKSLKELQFEGTIEEWESRNLYINSDTFIERIICSDGVIEI